MKNNIFNNPYTSLIISIISSIIAFFSAWISYRFKQRVLYKYKQLELNLQQKLTLIEHLSKVNYTKTSEINEKIISLINSLETSFKEYEIDNRSSMLKINKCFEELKTFVNTEQVYLSENISELLFNFINDYNTGFDLFRVFNDASSKKYFEFRDKLFKTIKQELSIIKVEKYEIK